MEIGIRIDPSETRILGVFNGEVHVQADLAKYFDEGVDFEQIIAIIPKREFLRIWGLWIDGKQRKCESYDHYCGVLGEFDAERFKELKGETITLNHWVDNGTEDGEEIKTTHRVFKITKFDNYPDFEHG